MTTFIFSIRVKSVNNDSFFTVSKFVAEIALAKSLLPPLLLLLFPPLSLTFFLLLYFQYLSKSVLIHTTSQYSKQSFLSSWVFTLLLHLFLSWMSINSNSTSYSLLEFLYKFLIILNLVVFVLVLLLLLTCYFLLQILSLVQPRNSLII